MSLLLLIGSYRVRAALLWLTHQSEAWGLLPLALVGAVYTAGGTVPAALSVAAGPLTIVLVIAAVLGGRLHAELDRAGLPCRWCEISGEVADDARP